jgi:hypothetical protein
VAPQGALRTGSRAEVGSGVLDTLERSCRSRRYLRRYLCRVPKTIPKLRYIPYNIPTVLDHTKSDRQTRRDRQNSDPVSRIDTSELLCSRKLSM